MKMFLYQPKMDLKKYKNILNILGKWSGNLEFDATN